MPLEVRPITEAELPVMLEVDRRGFGATHAAPERADSWVKAELSRTQCAFEAGAMIGCTRAYSFELTMPGGALVPVAAVSAVAVQPSHRRRGVLSSMIAALHDDALSTRRGRGGAHGIGRRDLRTVRIRARHLATGCHDRPLARRVRAPGRRLRLCAHGRAGEADVVFQQVYEEARRARAGMVSRPEFWWPEVFWFLEESRHALFQAVHEDERGHPDGFVAYEIKGERARRRRRPPPRRARPAGDDLGRARRAVGVPVRRRSRDVHLALSHLPPDEPLRFLLADGRALRTDFLIDSVWVLPLDAAALVGVAHVFGGGQARDRSRGSRRIARADRARRWTRRRAVHRAAGRSPRSLVLAGDVGRRVARRYVVGDVGGGRRGQRTHPRCPRPGRRDVRHRARARNDELVLSGGF